jgi:hypothetical protein
MIYVAHQITPMPGKTGELIEAASRMTESLRSHGEKQIGGFVVSLGQSVGSLIYIVAYEDAAAYAAVQKAMNDSTDFKNIGSLIISTSSAVLQPLPGWPIQ